MENMCEKYLHFYFSHVLLLKIFNICIVDSGEK